MKKLLIALFISILIVGHAFAGPPVPIPAGGSFLGGTLTSELITAASTAGGAGLNLPHGTAPSSPANGDVWTTTAGIYVRVNGVTVGPLVAGGMTNPMTTAGDIIYGGVDGAATRMAKGAANTLFGVDADGNLNYISSISPKFVEVDGHTDSTNLTAANLSRTFINSFGRAGAATLTLPAAAAGYSAVFIVGTQHNSLWKIQRAGSDTIYWDSGGTLTAGKTYFGETNQAVGSRVSCSTFRTGASAYSWLCGVVSGTWTTD